MWLKATIITDASEESIMKSIDTFGGEPSFTLGDPDSAKTMLRDYLVSQVLGGEDEVRPGESVTVELIDGPLSATEDGQVVEAAA